MENKERILESALDLFYTKGYDAVGVQEIAERAGITKPTLYYYFGSKYGLLESLLETYSAQLYEEVAQAAVYKGDVPATLYEIASRYIDYAVNNRKIYMLMMALFYSAKENEAYQAVKPFITKFYTQMVQVFENAAPQLGNMRGRQKQFAIGFIGIINHYILLVCETSDQEILVDEETKKSLVQQFMYGIFS